MGFTTAEKKEVKDVQKLHSNPIKMQSHMDKAEFYSFLQELNVKTEIGME